ncbi:Cytochrome bo(3) ubiquinol oxidase subunit 4 [invertebrate metagenome]|uniref:Cytochrome bo(3) ubiquinol oxidase subunit 4 n=1 Tax=invertebrate metagenome TaxID=1711999 RepID=A0A2H9T899_9ZZZZ
MRDLQSSSAHGSIKEYAVGFILSVILTAIPFAVVLGKLLASAGTIIVILLCAIVQIVVHLVFFLHMNGTAEQYWNRLSAVFVVLVVVILIIGSVWIMEHLHHNMMMGQ